MNSFEDKDEKGNYTGPRGKTLIEVFVCHGCQSCWRLSEDGESIIDTGPHILSESKIVTDRYVNKEESK